jgi:sugar phosphate isomerase/epimerase
MPGYYRDGCADVNQFIADFRPAAEKFHAAGLTFMYHNHDFEFEKRDGALLIDQLAEGFPPAWMGFTLDTYWVQAGGGSPAAWLKKLKGRADVIHIKDMSWKNGKIHMSEVGEGNLDWPGILEACKEAGVKYAMVEQDDCYGADPFDCLCTSYENWRKIHG